MAEIVIGSSYQTYRKALLAGDEAGNRNGRIDSPAEARSAAIAFNRDIQKPEDKLSYSPYLHSFLMFLDASGFNQTELAKENINRLKQTLETGTPEEKRLAAVSISEIAKNRPDLIEDGILELLAASLGDCDYYWVYGHGSTARERSFDNKFATALSKFGSRAVPLLKKAFAFAAKGAFDALRTMDPALYDEEILKAAAEGSYLYGTYDTKSVNYAIDILRRAGKRSLPFLLEALKSESAEVRYGAAGAVYSLNVPAEEYSEELIELLARDLANSRRELWRISRGLPISYPSEWMSYSQSRNRYSAADALSRIGKKAVPYLSEALKSKDTKTSGEAAFALLTIAKGSPELISDEMISLLIPFCDELRLDGSFEKIGGRSIPFLLEAAKNHVLGAYIGLWSICKNDKTLITDEMVSVLLSALKNPQRSGWSSLLGDNEIHQICIILGNSGKDLVEHIRTMLVSNDPQIRNKGIYLLHSYTFGYTEGKTENRSSIPEEFIPLLIGDFSNPSLILNEHISDVAAKTVGQIGEKSIPYLQELARSLPFLEKYADTKGRFLSREEALRRKITLALNGIPGDKIPEDLIHFLLEELSINESSYNYTTSDAYRRTGEKGFLKAIGILKLQESPLRLAAIKAIHAYKYHSDLFTENIIRTLVELLPGEGLSYYLNWTLTELGKKASPFLEIAAKDLDQKVAKEAQAILDRIKK